MYFSFLMKINVGSYKYNWGSIKNGLFNEITLPKRPYRSSKTTMTLFMTKICGNEFFDAFSHFYAQQEIAEFKEIILVLKVIYI